ncbi:MAG: cell division protein FtsZ [Chitinophagaceae bacterium]
MIHFDLPKQKSSIIKVIGIGGGGSNAVNFMQSQEIEGVDFVICNTDAKAIEQSNVLNKIQLGPASTQGLGAGANPNVGRTATEESLQEIKSILEVNTKMAFITAGMGGGTGTGGAPIVAKVCKDLNILTVGIVTTPFSFEGPRRMQQAQEGIKELKPHVDTLLVISNDKLREQYGNLKMREAFSKADNVLATAAKCITDVINSKGHIIVDFADVCTVMKNGGVAVLGNSAVEGENRAQLAIEEALNSPLLNDSEIKGAKWILLNINSPEGDYECTMDELEVISNHLRSQAGEFTDVIVGMGNDNTLDKKLGITLIATGFEHKDPFEKVAPVVKKEQAPAKVIFTLGEEETPKPVEPKLTQQAIPFADDNMYAPTLVEPTGFEAYDATVSVGNLFTDFDIQREQLLDARETEIFELELASSTNISSNLSLVNNMLQDAPVELVNKNSTATEVDVLANTQEESIARMVMVEKPLAPEQKAATTLLSKPVNVYSSLPPQEQQTQAEETTNPFRFELSIKEGAELNNKPTLQENNSGNIEEENEIEELHFEVKNKVEENNVAASVNVVEDLSEDEIQKRRAQERIQKLRNLSFNMNGSDAGNEFDTVPAYVRRNMELFGNNTLASVENFYSNITVNKNEKEETNFSTINTFLHGNKPD